MVENLFNEILTSHRSIQVGILLFEDVEILDFAGPFEVFSVAARVCLRDGIFPVQTFQVHTVAARNHVTARHGLKVISGLTFEDAFSFDLLIVPGGVVNQPLEDPKTLGWVRQVASHAKITASVCTGAFILAKAGCLDGLRATTHWEDISAFRDTFPNVEVIEEVAFVDEGNIITSAGISAGIDMSLHLVSRILGNEIAQKTARQMQY